MREVIIKNRKQTEITDEALYALDDESHRIWAEKGLDAPWMHRPFTEFQRIIHSVTVFVALDAETGELLGMHCFRAYQRKGWCYGFLLAVTSSVQREGIASKMLAYEVERIRQSGYRYIREVTATTADWSVRWHLKNGYRIVGYYRVPNDNFTNYVFRKQLMPSILWGPTLGPLTARMSFAASWLVNHLLKHSDGRDNLMGRFARKLIHKGH